MVETRLKRGRKLLEMVAESQAGSSRGVQDATMALMEKLLERMDDLETFWTKKMDLLDKE